jgi:hypothetical protein
VTGLGEVEAGRFFSNALQWTVDFDMVVIREHAGLWA